MCILYDYYLNTVVCPRKNDCHIFLCNLIQIAIGIQLYIINVVTSLLLLVLTMEHFKLYFTNLTVFFSLLCRPTVFVTFLFSFNLVFNLLYYLFAKIRYYVIVMFSRFCFLCEKFIFLISG